MKMEPYKIKTEVLFYPLNKDFSFDVKILYECDRKVCEKCNNEDCHLTSDIKHAKRFDLFE